MTMERRLPTRAAQSFPLKLFFSWKLRFALNTFFHEKHLLLGENFRKQMPERQEVFSFGLKYCSFWMENIHFGQNMSVFGVLTKNTSGKILIKKPTFAEIYCSKFPTTHISSLLLGLPVFLLHTLFTFISHIKTAWKSSRLYMALTPPSAWPIAPEWSDKERPAWAFLPICQR